MNVGVYIDGYNLYYGGRAICGRGTAGWRWLDVRALVNRVIKNESAWPNITSLRVVYCTARIRGADSLDGQRDQDAYLRALVAAQAVDVIEYGTYVSRVATAPLATVGKKGKPRITKPEWPMMIKDQASGQPVVDALFMASIARREEKGSDVNVATHMLWDVLNGDIDAAVVVSNDSDLGLPVQLVRGLVPVGLVNPTKSYPAGVMNASPSAGAGSHWWYQLNDQDFRQSQMSDQLGKIYKPAGW